MTQQNPHSPVLILAQNKYGEQCRSSAEELTTKMNLDACDLLKFFSDLRCISLSFQDTESSPNDNENFKVQIDDLK